MTASNLYSRARKPFNRQFSYTVEALADLPSGTVVDGELVAINEIGRPDFNLESGHLRHSKFGGLRSDKDARSVVKE